MNTEQTSRLTQRAAVHAALADVTRLRIIDLLALSDRSASELGTALDIPSNLLAHHLKTLDSVGMITRRKSEGDARRSYLSLKALDDVLVREVGGGHTAVKASRVVFVCTANTARSHLAAAAWRRVSTVPATSAGTHPGETIHPGAIAAAQRHDLDLPNVPPRELDEDHHDLVVTVCDRAHEDLEGRDWAHWSIPDPVLSGTTQAFEAAVTEVSDRVARMVTFIRGTA